MPRDSRLPPPSKEALARVIEVAEAFTGFLDDHPEEAASWIQGDDWSHDDESDENLGAWQDDLDEALNEAVSWLATQLPATDLSSQVAEVLAGLAEKGKSSDLGERWSERMAEESPRSEIIQGRDRNEEVPHDVLYQAFGQHSRHLWLRTRMSNELRRLPALEDELNRAGEAWR